MKKIDLTGKRFGKLTVLGENTVPYISPSGKKTRRWDCICDCGEKLTMLQNTLTKATSCGCMRIQPQRDMIGQKFGRLTVIKIVKLPKERKTGQKNGWLCRCDCGNEIITTRKELLSGKKLSCGCFLSEIAHKKVEKDNVFGFYDGTAVSHIKPQKNGQEKYKGVRIRSGKRGVRYSARLMIKGKEISLGTYDTMEQAIQARLEGEKKYFEPVIKQYQEEQER